MCADSSCPRSEEAAAYLAGEPAGDFEAHLATCAECTRAVSSARSLVSLLRSAPRAEVSRDLTPDILARVSAPRSARRWPVAAAFAAAAAVVLMLGVSRMTKPRQDSARIATSEQESAARAIDWLRKAQEPDGSWSAARWGGDRRFDVALTALPLLALQNAERADAESDRAIAAAVQCLRRRQAANGSFGSAFFGSYYNQGVATFALLRAYERQPDADLRRAVVAACEVIAATQTVAGGWGYAGSAQPHAAITLWNCEALHLAHTLRVAEVGESLERAAAWRSTQPATGSGIDFYHARVLAAVLDRNAGAATHEKRKAFRAALMASQIREGADSGSWAPSDPWARVGGRLYSTALASLALR